MTELQHDMEARRRRTVAGLLSSVRKTTIGVIAVVVVADQATKAFVRELVPLHESISLVPGLLNFVHVRNTGAAFGILNAADFPFKSAVMTGVAVVALIALVFYAATSSSHGIVAQFGLALIVGGAIGNLTDRVVVGYVIDFVDVYWRAHHFWAFNVADSAITVGAGLLLLDMVGLGRNASKTL